jgi:hypothetical protein
VARLQETRPAHGAVSAQTHARGLCGLSPRASGRVRGLPSSYMQQLPMCDGEDGRSEAERLDSSPVSWDDLTDPASRVKDTRLPKPSALVNRGSWYEPNEPLRRTELNWHVVGCAQERAEGRVAASCGGRGEHFRRLIA